MTLSAGASFTDLVSTNISKETLLLTIHRGVFIYLFGPQINFAFEVQGHNVSPSYLQKLLLSLNVTTNNLQVKIIGQESLVSQVEAFFNSQRIKIASSVKRQNSEFSLIFYPKTGRIRLEKEIDDTSNKTKKTKTRVLIVDDSLTIRKMLTSLMETDPELEVVATADKPSLVEDLIKKFNPEVITLDIHMPEMNGVELLKIIQPKYRIPTVMITSVSKEEGPLVLDALEAGAIDYIQKPTMQELKQLTPLILEKIKTAAKSKRASRLKLSSRALIKKSTSIDENLLIAIGSSTGGTEALKEILIRLPENIPPIVIVQHIPAVFSEAFAKRLDALCPFAVKEAKDGEIVEKRSVYIAPGGKQMSLQQTKEGLKIRVKDDPPVNRHCPSVDVLFDSIAAEFKASTKIIGVILTGMGADGAKGLLKLKNQGARTIAQNEESSVVFGMPRVAIQLGAATEVLALEDIPEKLMSWASSKK